MTNQMYQKSLELARITTQMHYFYFWTFIYIIPSVSRHRQKNIEVRNNIVKLSSIKSLSEQTNAQTDNREMMLQYPC